MTRYAPRIAPLVQKNSEPSNTESEFISKISVQPYRPEPGPSIADQINAIIHGRKPKYSSVEDVVKEMQERSGFSAHQNKMKVLADRIKEAASNNEEIRAFSMNPQIKSTLDNFITDTKGNFPIPSIIDRIKSIHKKDVDDNSVWDDESLIKYINNKSIQVKKDHPDINDTDYSNLGHLPNYDEKDIAKSNQDPLHCLMPSVIK
jgi:hypothetical protein